MPAPISPLSFAPELACSPSVFVKVEKNDQSQATDVATQTEAEPSVTPAHDSTAIAAAIPCTVDSEPLYPELASSDPTCWPSEVYNRTSTMWLLPPHSNQSSAIATLLQAEIQSHNTTREMLHTTEQRRLEAVQRSNRFASDAQGWATAYNNLNTALGKCAEECSRVAAENVTLKSQMRCFKVSLAEPLQATTLHNCHDPSSSPPSAPINPTFSRNTVVDSFACQPSSERYRALRPRSTHCAFRVLRTNPPSLRTSQGSWR